MQFSPISISSQGQGRIINLIYVRMIIWCLLKPQGVLELSGGGAAQSQEVRTPPVNLPLSELHFELGPIRILTVVSIFLVEIFNWNVICCQNNLNIMLSVRVLTFSRISYDHTKRELWDGGFYYDNFIMTVQIIWRYFRKTLNIKPQ